LLKKINFSFWRDSYNVINIYAKYIQKYEFYMSLFKSRDQE